MTEDRRKKTEDRGQKTEDGKQRTEVFEFGIGNAEVEGSAAANEDQK